jgi:hypothetical protein
VFQLQVCGGEGRGNGHNDTERQRKAPRWSSRRQREEEEEEEEEAAAAAAAAAEEEEEAAAEEEEEEAFGRSPLRVLACGCEILKVWPVFGC